MKKIYQSNALITRPISEKVEFNNDITSVMTQLQSKGYDLEVHPMNVTGHFAVLILGYVMNKE